jgi:hypothetical protein
MICKVAVKARAEGDRHRLGDARHAGRTDYRRLLLPVGEAAGFLLVGVCATKTLAVRVEEGDLIVLVLPPFVRPEIRSASRLHSFSRLFRFDSDSLLVKRDKDDYCARDSELTCVS